MDANSMLLPKMYKGSTTRRLVRPLLDLTDSWSRPIWIREKLDCLQGKLSRLSAPRAKLTRRFRWRPIRFGSTRTALGSSSEWDGEYFILFTLLPSDGHISPERYYIYERNGAVSTGKDLNHRLSSSSSLPITTLTILIDTNAGQDSILID